ncbi:MAG TPA: rhodanese-like domain-containing protein [Candidatus Saccharimonadales bacterium]|nr:rhodanese-like domain-containing protein [Candidatus Saccharimonadales bacterium]
MNKDIVSDVHRKRAQLLDVRTLPEWSDSHASPAVHIPLQELNENNLSILSPELPIYVYCQSGNRAGLAVKVLEQKGFKAFNIGGLTDWKSAGGEISS